MIYAEYPRRFQEIVAEFEENAQNVLGVNPEFFPLFEPKELDSYLTTYKINRITDLQHKSSILTDKILIHGACTEIMHLRMVAERARQEHFAKQRSTSSKNVLTNLAALTTMVVSVGAFVVTLLGERNAKQ